LKQTKHFADFPEKLPKQRLLTSVSTAERAAEPDGVCNVYFNAEDASGVPFVL
jgi:hypothetical protein